MEIDNNFSLERQPQRYEQRVHTSQSLSTRNIDAGDRFTARVSRYDFDISMISIFSFSSAISLLKDLRNEQNSRIRNAIVSKLINNIANDISYLYRSGLIFLLSKKELARIAKQLKEICKEIDEMIREGLVQLDFATMLDYQLTIKCFIACYDKEVFEDKENKRIIIFFQNTETENNQNKNKTSQKAQPTKTVQFPGPLMLT